MLRDRAGRDKEGGRDLRVRLTSLDEVQYFLFSGSESERIGSGRRPGPRGSAAAPCARSFRVTMAIIGCAPSRANSAKAYRRAASSLLSASATAASYGHPNRRHQAAALFHLPFI